MREKSKGKGVVGVLAAERDILSGTVKGDRPEMSIELTEAVEVRQRKRGTMIMTYLVVTRIAISEITSPTDEPYGEMKTAKREEDQARPVLEVGENLQIKWA